MFAMIKGGNTIITKDADELNDLFISIAWKVKENVPFVPDIDASLFLIGNHNKVRTDQDFIFYNNGIDGDKSVIYIRKQERESIQRTEGFIVHLQRLPSDINKLVFSLTLHDWEEHQQTFKHALSSATVSVTDRSSNNVIANYDLSEDFGDETAIMLGELYRHAGGWKFRAVGQGFTGGLKALAEHFGVNVEKKAIILEEVPSMEESKRNRRSRQQIMEGYKACIKEGLQRFLPQINNAINTHQNESSTRMIFDRILQDIFAYRMEEIKTEQIIQGRKADYVLSVDDKDMLVIEIKRVGMVLRDKQIFQATAYGAYSGIKWALLTNLLSWQLYRISTSEKVEANLVFEVDLRNGLEDDAIYCLYLISRDGITRKGLLEQLWVRASALTCESLIAAVLNEDVISKIRSILNRESGSRLTNQEVREALERKILQMD